MSTQPTKEQLLREFAREVLSDWPDTCSLDGGDLQELAVKYGLLEPITVTEPCNPDHCMCAEVGDFPLTCYRKTSVLTGEAS